MPDYSKSKIYKIICSETQQIYIGSTTQPLSKRLSQHKKGSTTAKNFIEPKIYLVETVCCDTKEELHARERYYIENIECVNLMIPGRTYNEWIEKNKEIIAEKKKDYHEKNKEKIAQRKKDYYEKNKDTISEKYKVYREENKDIIAEKFKKRYEENKDTISEKKKVKYTCECGSTLRKSDIRQHERTKKHQDFISQSK